jgi:membrane-associated phospholipid phosphatase
VYYNMTGQVKSFFMAVCLMASACAFAASPEDAQSGPASKSPSQPVSIYEERPINWKTIVPDVARDQRTIWTVPAQLVRGEHLKPALGITIALGALVALDPHDTPYFRNTSAFSGFNRGLSSTNAIIATALVPASFYALGYVRKDSYATHTSLLAGESLVDTGILAWVLKNATGRVRPSAIPPGGSYSDTWFKTYQPPLRADVSFPSEHAVAAFSVATIIARRYPSHRWVPWVAYGAAALIGFSRVTLRAHFPSDVFAGAAFGYVISRYVVMPGREPEF